MVSMAMMGLATVVICGTPHAALAAHHKSSHAKPRTPPAPAGDAGLGRAAFTEIDHGHYDVAERLLARIGDRTLVDAIKAELYERAPTDFNYREIAGFLATHPAWPGRTALLRATEQLMPGGFPDQDVIAWFDASPPLTFNGFNRYAQALADLGQTEKLSQKVREYWVKANFIPGDDAAFQAHFGNYLTRAENVARFDRLVWDRQTGQAQRMLPILGDNSGWLAVARARLALAENDPNAEAYVGLVPRALQTDPGLLYERLHWRRLRNLDDEAVTFLKLQPAGSEHADQWWNERHIIARRFLAVGNAQLAYNIAASHGELDGDDLASAEWLAGWIAFRKLNDPETAQQHFSTMYQEVALPMSRARAAYWLGRVAQAQNDLPNARQWYEDSATRNTSFYGQLAATHLSAQPVMTAELEPPLPQEWVNHFMSGEIPRLILLLHRMNEDKRAGNFVHALAEYTNMRAELVELAQLSAEIHRPDLQVQISKIAAQKNIILAANGYPTLRDKFFPETSVEPALIHALIRQESMFRPDAGSSAGALGLMQLMPATARGISGSLGQRFSVERLTEDPAYNIELGSAYIRRLIDSFNGSYILAIASYNAGAGRVREWISMFGDPRDPAIDPIDWIESIPVPETRNYVQRVLEGTQVYRARLNDGTAPLQIAYDLRRGAYGVSAGR